MNAWNVSGCGIEEIVIHKSKKCTVHCIIRQP